MHSILDGMKLQRFLSHWLGLRMPEIQLISENLKLKKNSDEGCPRLSTSSPHSQLGTTFGGPSRGPFSKILHPPQMGLIFFFH